MRQPDLNTRYGTRQPTVSIPIVHGDHTWTGSAPRTRGPPGEGVWSGRTCSRGVGPNPLYLMSWDNPHPDKKIAAIDYSSKKEETPAAPFCIAISAEVK